MLFIAILACAQELLPTPNNKGKIGYLDDKGNVVIKYQYTEAYPFNDKGFAIVKDDDKYGLINKTGESLGDGISYSVLEPIDSTELYLIAIGGDHKKYECDRKIFPKIFRGSVEHKLENSKWGIMNSNGTVILDPVYSDISACINGYIYVCKKGKCGVIDKTGKVIVEPKKYTFISNFNKQKQCLAISGNNINVLNCNGNPLFSSDVTSVGMFMPNSKLGSDVPFSNINQYDEAEPMTWAKKLTYTWNNSPIPYIWYKYGTLYGVSDIQGNPLLQKGEYTESSAPGEGFMFVYKNDKNKKNKSTMIYNLKSKEVIQVDSSCLFVPFYHGFSMAVRNDKKAYFIDYKGVKSTEMFDSVYKCVDDYYVASLNGKFGLIDSKMNVKIPFKYDKALANVSDGKLGLCKGGFWGYFDINNKQLTPMKYSSISDFKDGKAFIAIEQNRKNMYGLIDSKCKEIISPKWDNVVYRSGEIQKNYWLLKDSLYTFYDASTKKYLMNNEVKGVEYFSDIENGCIIKSAITYKWGYFDDSGKILIPCGVLTADLAFEAYKKFKKSHKEKWEDIDVYRFNAEHTSVRNSYFLKDIVPEDNWDY